MSAHRVGLPSKGLEENNLDLKGFVIPAIFSVFVAIASWLLLNFWMKPIVQYLELKRAIKEDLVNYGDVLEPLIVENEYLLHRRHERQDRNRLHAGEIRAINDELPAWFRWYLRRVKEDPTRASVALVGMSNANEVVDIEHFLGSLKTALRIPTNFNW